VTDRDEMMRRAEGAVRDFESASSDLSLSYTDALDALLTAIRACLDWTPGCGGCEGCRWNDGDMHPTCSECCLDMSAFPDHYEPKDSPDDE